MAGINVGIFAAGNLDQFAQVLQGGMRQYLFYFIPEIPTSFATGQMITYLVRSTNAPDSTFEQINAAWQGQPYKVPGNRTFSDFSVTFNSDPNGLAYKSFLNWQNQIRNIETGQHALPAEYMRPQNLQMLNPQTLAPVVIYTLYGAWPSNISGVTLDYTSNDILQFTVTFTYQYHLVDGII